MWASQIISSSPLQHFWEVGARGESTVCGFSAQIAASLPIKHRAELCFKGEATHHAVRTLRLRRAGRRRLGACCLLLASTSLCLPPPIPLTRPVCPSLPLPVLPLPALSTHTLFFSLSSSKPCLLSPCFLWIHVQPSGVWSGLGRYY